MARKSKEATKAYWKEYYKKHREEILKHRKENRDPEKQDKYHKEWLENNREKWNAYMREYKKKRELAKKNKK